MAMPLKSDVARARSAGGAPVDLAHLSAATLGDAALEREVLSLFVAHAPLYMAAWRAASGVQPRKMAAHTLKGAARGIGAWRLAELAGEAEAPGCAGGELEAELDRVCRYIGTLT